jgi:hypothetical protein
VTARGRLVALLGLALAGGLLVAVLGGGGGGSRSSTDRGPDGTAALAGVLGRLGHEVHGLRLGLHVLPRTPLGFLVLASPPGLVAQPALTPTDADRLLAWVESGGVVVHLTDRQDPVLDALGLEIEASALPRPARGSPPLVAEPTRPCPWTLGGPLAVRTRAGLVGSDREPLFVVGDVTVASLHRRGRGELLVVTDPGLGSNEALGASGNLALFVHAAGALGAKAPVVFDDLHAGGGDAHGGIAYAREAGGGGAVAFGALGLLLLLWRLSARETSVQPGRAAVATGGTSEYVRGLAGLYERARLGRHALAVTSRQFRRRIEARAGMPWEREALSAWLVGELGVEAASEFRAVREAFGRLFVLDAPPVEEVRAAAVLAARFERRWLARRAGPASRTGTVPSSAGPPQELP